jgi:tetratricopeptide (TPR) repeat protein
LSQELDELVENHPEQIDIRVLRAAVAAQLGDLDRADEELQQAREQGLDPQMLALQKARLYLSVRQPDKAIVTLQEACRQAPQTQPATAGAWAWLELADLQRTRGQVEEARQTLKAALQAVAGGGTAQRDVLLKLAVLEIVQGDHAAGIDILRSLAAQDPRNIHIRTMLLAVPDVQQNAEEAERIVREIQQVEGPRGLTWRLWQASAWLAAPDWRKRQQEIEANLQRCIDADPGWATPALLLGRVHEQSGNADRAEAIYRNVLAADPAALEVADRLLDLLQRQGRLSQAGDVLKGLDAMEASLGSRRTLVAMETGQIDQAIDELKVRTTHDPQDVQSRVLLAQLVYRQTRDAEQALRYLDEAEAISPGSIAVTMGRVIILNSEGRRPEAVEQLDALVQRKDSFESHQLRGSYLASIGQIDQAEKDYIHLSELPGDGTGHQVLGAFYAQTQRLDRAIATWRAGLAAHADNLVLQRSLMRGLLQQGESAGVAEAEQILSDLEVRLPKDPELMTLRASLLLGEHNDAATTKAGSLLETAVQIAPTYIDAHLGLISLALQRHDYVTARKRSVFALGINASDIRLLVLRAQTELALENFVMARDLAGIILKDRPHDPQVRHVLVQAALGTGNQRDLQNALAAVRAELGRTPDDLALRLTGALLLSKLGQAEEAVASLEEYIATPVGRQSIEAIVSLADLHQSRGERVRAEQLLQEASALQPTHPAVLRGRVNWLAAGQEYDEIQHMMSGYAASPSADAGVLEAAGTALAGAADKAQREKALEFFQAAIQIASDPMSARIQYASLAYQLGHVDAAETMYRRILQADSNNVQALNDLAWLLSKDRGRSEEALDMANRAAHLAPDSIHVRDTRGTILATLPGRLADARREFETCVDLAAPDSPERARALLQLGRVFCKLENPGQAKLRLDEARRIDSQQDVFSPTERSEIDKLTQASVLGGGTPSRS